MRFALLIALFSSFASADTINGVDYEWNFEPVSNSVGTITAYFSAPVSAYEFEVTFPASAVSPEVFIASPDPTNTTWSGDIYNQQIATVAGLLPDMDQLEVTIEQDPRAGLIYPVNFVFSRLVDPPSGIAAVPEPSTLWLIGGGLALTMLTCTSGRRALSLRLKRT